MADVVGLPLATLYEFSFLSDLKVNVQIDRVALVLATFDEGRHSLLERISPAEAKPIARESPPVLPPVSLFVDRDKSLIQWELLHN